MMEIFMNIKIGYVLNTVNALIYLNTKSRQNQNVNLKFYIAFVETR